MTQEASVRFDVIRQLQALCARPDHSQKFSDAADHAIGLALSPRRQAREYLLRDVLRDAKRILRRKRQHDHARFCSLDAPVASPEYSGDELTLADTIAAPDLAPDQVTITNETATALDQHFASDPSATAVLIGMRRGESSAETAADLGMSRSNVKKIRSRVRRTGLALLSR